MCFFHVKVTHHVCKNRFEGLKNLNGRWVNDLKKVSEVAWYFLDLFTSDCYDDVD